MAPQISDLYSSKNVNESGEKFYVTTAINYTNGLPHIGHAYEALLADVIARYHRAYGRNVFFLTGTDEHGQKIATSAEAKGMKPIELCDMYVEKFRELNEALHISNDEYIRTTDHYHEESCRALWKRCSENGDIYLGEYTGWYDVREETFVTDSDAQKMNFKDAYGTDLKKVSEPCYFFRLSKYRERLVQYYEENPEAIMPTIRRQEVLAMLASYPELPDLCISRTAFDWGVSLPDGFQEKHVMYVWFDALTNYISASHLVLPEDQQDPKRTALWPADCHVVGKDITRFHCIYWPAMLWSAGIAPPKCVAGHGFVQDGEGKKMSKSVGNVVDPNDLLKSYPSDSIRYYCVNEANFGPDLKCSEANLVEAHNNNLADTVGNLMQRAVKLPELYTNGLVPAKPAGASLPLPFDLAALKASVEEYMKSYQTKPALMEIIAACSAVNNWITTTAPFKMKEADQQDTRTLCVRLALEAVYAVAHFLAPFLPVTCTHIFNKLQPGTSILALSDDFSNLQEGLEIKSGTWAEGVDVLFSKIKTEEEKKAEELKEAQKDKKPAKAKTPPPKAASPKQAKSPSPKPEFGEDGWRLAIKEDLDARYYLQEYNGKVYPEVSGVLTLDDKGIFDEAVYMAGEAPEGQRGVYTEKGAHTVILSRTGGIKYDPKKGTALLKPHHSTVAAEVTKDGNPSYEVKVSQKGLVSFKAEGDEKIWTRKRQL
eukprot:Rhum_TRINITY_DN6288_c0_g2::Rhum_TRINITY_DN6288_c0_g2_i1::g.19342::m.19342/K01874/MARS, metG; methionyl-tRNA synthetase